MLLVVSVQPGIAQYSRYIVELKDKQNSSYNINQPATFLSPKSVLRRTRFNIPIDSTDLPVNSSYLSSIASIENVSIISVSRWLNQVLIQTNDTAAITKIKKLYFVNITAPIALSAARNIITVDKFKNEKTEIATSSLSPLKNLANSLDYGQSFGQIHLHEGEYLHNKGFTGDGITIAIMDAGFFNFNTIKAFDSIRRNNQIKGVWDFVQREASVSEDNQHGMNCLSIIASNLPGNMVGTAPKSSFYLFRTEDDKSEYPIEEHHWVVAAEQADSLGADMISSSVGYADFDDASFNHSYADLDGDKTMITRAADLAARKGIIVCNSAGNSGNTTWKYIIAPADGDSVLAIGATDVNGVPATFSSYGPSF
ncbi:MAG: S8 family serine peptidase, partial [Chitinophagaceae bacterium]